MSGRLSICLDCCVVVVLLVVVLLVVVVVQFMLSDQVKALPVEDTNT